MIELAYKSEKVLEFSNIISEYISSLKSAKDIKENKKVVGAVLFGVAIASGYYDHIIEEYNELDTKNQWIKAVKDDACKVSF